MTMKKRFKKKRGPVVAKKVTFDGINFASGLEKYMYCVLKEAKIKAEAEAKEKKRRAVETARLEAMAEAERKKQESEENRRKAREEEFKSTKETTRAKGFTGEFGI